MKNIVVVLGNPKESSLGEKLTMVYVNEIRNHKVNVEILDLKKMEFSTDLVEGYKTELEKDILDAQEKIKKSDMLVISYPVYWYNYPARLRGFIDKVFWPEVAMSMKGKRYLFTGFFRGKKARLIVTRGGSLMDSLLLSLDSGINSLKGSLRLTGIFSVKSLIFDNVDNSKRATEESMMARAKKAAREDLKRLGVVVK